MHLCSNGHPGFEIIKSRCPQIVPVKAVPYNHCVFLLSTEKENEGHR